MQEIGAFEAKNTLGGLLDRVEKGEEIMITRRGRPIAVLSPVFGAQNRNKARMAASALRALLSELKDGPPFTLEEIKAWRDEGRR